MNATVNTQKGYDFVITDHVRERFVERFSRESRYFSHLSRCRGCERCRELTFWLVELVREKRDQWDKIICAKLHDAKDVKIYQNNATFMDYMYTHYGYHRFRFLVESGILFVVIETNGKHVVRTCMDVNYPVNGSRVIADFMHRPRYNKRAI